MSEFHFLRPWWLLASLPFALFCWHLLRRRQSGDWHRICDAALLPHILVDDAGRPVRPTWPLLALGGALAILALAGPVWERLPTPTVRNDSALIIALDLSRTMDAADVKPSRLERARYKIADILKQRKDGLTALLVYSGEAFTVTPLTDDAETINSQLSALSSALIPTQGSRADLALEHAGRLLKQAGLTRGDVLLVTSGVNLSKGSPAARELLASGYRLSVLGAGGEEGAPVPLPEGGFLQDGKGNIVISKLASPALRQLAEEGGGLYRTLAADNSDLSILLPFFERPDEAAGNAGAETGATVEQWEERGPWLLLPLLPIAALAFRRGYAAVLFALVLPLPEPASAMDWQDLWQNRDQRASKAFEAGDPAAASQIFENPAWKAAAQYRANQYEEAAATWQGAESADAHYNRGNALAKLGRYPAAIAAYEKALKLDPGHEDARHNKEIVEKALQDQQQRQEQNQQQSDSKEAEQDRDKGERKQDHNSGQNSEPRQNAQESPSRDPTELPQNADKQTADGKPEREQQRDRETNDDAGNRQPQNASRADEQKSDAKEMAQMQAQERNSEDQQANEQWLRRIPDDPGGLLKRKFYYQYQQRQSQHQQGIQP